ncbi:MULTISPECIES: hypothetical protein [Streptomyces]|uniref:hypothetical protein n=1 Tax=Streptomyces TaxID=1883 RepID=UPI002E2B5AB5|nr:hypothetical protein [Streptomyces sp. NBC_00269]
MGVAVPAPLLPFLARLPLLVWALLAVTLLYLLLIVLLSLTAVYAKELARRRAATEMVRILWFTTGRKDDQGPDPDPRA